MTADGLLETDVQWGDCTTRCQGEKVAAELDIWYLTSDVLLSNVITKGSLRTKMLTYQKGRSPIREIPTIIDHPWPSKDLRGNAGMSYSTERVSGEQGRNA